MAAHRVRVCVCVCVCMSLSLPLSLSHTGTLTHSLIHSLTAQKSYYRYELEILGHAVHVQVWMCSLVFHVMQVAAVIVVLLVLV